MDYYLGADIGSSKTQVMIADGAGRKTGLGLAGPGNHQTVGYAGMLAALRKAATEACDQTGISAGELSGSGFGISGYDWPSDAPHMLQVINKLGLGGHIEIHNDAILGLVAGTAAGWGIAVVSGTGCNCWGWDKKRNHIGRVTGFGDLAGEAAGSTELVYRAMQLVAHAWTQRGQRTALTEILIRYAGAEDEVDLLEGYTTNRYQVDGNAAPLIFQAAEDGDPVATQLIDWAGRELGEMVKAVIRQLNFQDLEFEVVLVGSMFKAGQVLIDPMHLSIQELAPKAHLVRLNLPPVVGGVLIGMQVGGLQVTPQIHQALADSFK
ncbi:MAG: hypothetical protein JSV42_18080 [Chloroflexota bacterium]|nr:MAG: hypothetical protein JSV42_18080 [Chloroflexota bacterium]